MLRVACRRLNRMLQQWDETRPTCGYQACGYAGSKSHGRKRVGRVRVRSGFLWAKCHQSLGSFVMCVSIFVAVIVWDLCFRLTLTSQACEHAVTGTGHLADGDVSCRMLSPLDCACMLQTRQPGRCRHSPLRFLPSSSWCRRSRPQLSLCKRHFCGARTPAIPGPAIPRTSRLSMLAALSRSILWATSCCCASLQSFQLMLLAMVFSGDS